MKTFDDTVILDQTLTLGTANSGQDTILKFVVDGTEKSTHLRFNDDSVLQFSITHWASGEKVVLCFS